MPLFHILTLSQTPLSSHIHPSKKKKSYYCFGRSPGELVTSMLPLGLPPLQALALFPGRIIPFKLQSYLRPILFPSPARGYQTIHPADFMSPCPVIKASVMICVLRTWVFAHVARMKGVCVFVVERCEFACFRFVYGQNKDFVWHVYVFGVINEDNKISKSLVRLWLCISAYSGVQVWKQTCVASH